MKKPLRIDTLIMEEESEKSNYDLELEEDKIMEEED
jgi:hypothetical protein